MAQDALKKIGKCINKTQCTNADSEKEIEILFGDEFVCPECSMDLVEIVKIKPPFPKWLKILVPAILALAGTGIFYFTDNNIYSNNTKNIVNVDMIINVNESLSLPDSIVNIVAKKNAEWHSSDPKIVTINDNFFIAHSVGEATLTAMTLDKKKDTLVIYHVTVEPDKTPLVNPSPVTAINIIVTIPEINSGQSTTLSYSGGSGKTFKWYSGCCGGTLVGEGNDLKVTPKVTTTYYGRWENDGNVSECQKVTVTVKANEPSKSPSSRNKTYSFGKYSGGMKNGYPEGQGTMVYTKRVQIAKHDNKEHYAEAGYSLVGTWINGDISNGKLIDKNGNTVEVILAGARASVYNLGNDN